jgi:hypothetical protein
MLRKLLRRRAPAMPYDLFDAAPSETAARQAEKLSRLYHTGQEKAWDGRAVLASLIEAHGRAPIPERERRALHRVFTGILWGELAAWKISAELADELTNVDAKLAATAQVHDEARHFYVLRDYLEWLGGPTPPPGPAARAVFDGVLHADQMVKKLLGMQLLIEPMALSLFQVVQRRRLEPVLSDLLTYYQKDEARHVALGVLHLPQLMRGLSKSALADLYLWQIRQYLREFDLIREYSVDFEILGVSPRQLVNVGRDKQLLALRELASEFGGDLPAVDLMRRVVDFRTELDFPAEGEPRDFRSRLRRAIRAAAGRMVIHEVALAG